MTQFDTKINSFSSILQKCCKHCNFVKSEHTQKNALTIAKGTFSIFLNGTCRSKFAEVSSFAKIISYYKCIKYIVCIDINKYYMKLLLLNGLITKNVTKMWSKTQIIIEFEIKNPELKYFLENLDKFFYNCF